MPLTPEQCQKLQTAIDNAREPGECRYTKDDQPCCVIAQLATLEGVSVETLKKLDDLSTNSIDHILDYGSKQPCEYEPYKMMAEKLQSYPTKMLQSMQNQWDSTTNSYVARDEMRHIVQKYS